MVRVTGWRSFAGAILLVAALGWSGSPPALAHCDTLDGPVVQDARRALESGDVAPVLKWIRADDESTVRETFRSALAVRKLGKEAQELADRAFFETVVRVHRAGEGAPYDGLKPAGSVPPMIRAADKALESGSVDALSRDLSGAIAGELQKRYRLALERRAHAAHSPEAGRAFVSAYVSYIHFVEAADGLLADEVVHPEQAGESSHRHSR